MNIVVPVDGSECSQRAVEHLIKTRACYGDPEQLDIHLLNVQHPLHGDVDMFIDHDEIKGYHRDEGLKALQPARKLLDQAGVNYTFHISLGDPAQVIVRYAAEKQCDQIVMGTHGRGVVAGLLMGSVTRRVLHLASVPVLLVK